VTLVQSYFRLIARACTAAVLLLAVNVAALAEDEPAPEDHYLNEVPMFGEGRLPVALQKANRKLVRDAYRTGASLTSSSNQAIERGWEAMSAGDTSTAIRRFNQAWLLDRRNGAVYWGFGVVLYERDKDTMGALKMFRRARRMQPNNPYLLVDFGRVLEETGKSDEAVILFLDAVSLNPDTQYAYVGLVRAYLKENDLQNALLFALEGKDRGDPISDDLISALEQLSGEGGDASAEVTLPAVPEWAR